MMKILLVLLGFFMGWFAVISQLYLMMENSIVSIPETIFRFFSFFTILTNTLVAAYFTSWLFPAESQVGSFFRKPGRLAAITVYISVVGLVYQFILRNIWEPVGMQKIIDEMLHSIIPLYVIVFWWFYEDKQKVDYGQMSKWLVYPLVYLVFILFRGAISGFYPYPFIDVNILGYGMVILNSLGLFIFFLGISYVYITMGKKWGKTLTG